MRRRESRRLFEAMWSPDRLHDVLAVPVVRRDDCLDHLATGLSLNGGRHHLPSPVAIRLCASVGDAGQNDVEQCGSHPTDEQYQEPEGRLRLYSIAIPHRRLPFQIRDAVQINLSSSEVLRGRRRLPSASDLACRSAAA
jgi:hypothetical protein